MLRAYDVRSGRRVSSAATVAVAGTSSTTRSAAASTAGRWATTTTRLRCASRARVSRRTCSVSSSRWALGSSSSTTGRPASTTRASATRARWPADRPAPSSPSGVLQAVGEGAYDVGEADAAQGLPHLVVAGRGAADPHVGADGVGQQPRSLRCPPDQAAPPARVEVGERGAAEPDVAGHGRQLAAERRPGASTCRSRTARRSRPGPGRAARGRADGSGRAPGE